MKNVIGILIVVSFLKSYSKNDINSDLLGNWKSTKSANVVELKFFKDFLVSKNSKKDTLFLKISDSDFTNEFIKTNN